MAVAGGAGAEPARLGRGDVERLVWFRREWYADVRHRGIAARPDYGSMMLGVLGRGGQVTAEDLKALALVVRQAHELRSEVKRFAGKDSLGLVVDRVVSGWRRDKPGGRPTVPGVDEDHSRLVSAFHAIGRLGFVGDLTAWLNNIVPGSRGTVRESVVNRKLVSLFGQALDDGSDISVTVGGRTFDVRLWAVAAGPPRVQGPSLVAAGEPGSGRYSGKGENRIYSYGDVAVARSAQDGGFGDAGPMVRLEGGAGRADLSLTGGRANVWGGGSWRRWRRRVTSSSGSRSRWVRLTCRWCGWLGCRTGRRGRGRTSCGPARMVGRGRNGELRRGGVHASVDRGRPGGTVAGSAGPGRSGVSGLQDVDVGGGPAVVGISIMRCRGCGLRMRCWPRCGMF